MKVELKNVKHSESLSEETAAFTASLYVNGKRIGTVSNHGTGGPHDFHYSDREAGTTFEAWAKTLPPDTAYGVTIESDAELVVGDLLEKYLAKKWLKRQCRNKTVFRLKGDNDGDWRTVSNKFSSDVKAAVIKHFDDKGDEVVAFANETL